MAYSELIKSFEKIRAYMRDFYVYGFRTRNDFDKKSARSYDNEKRRVESWLGDYMSFHKDESGKNVFISVDSRDVAYNPLYQAYKAKSFTDKDITLHFFILDILADGSEMSASDIAETIADDYLSFTDTDMMPDVSTVRNKLKEYEELGILKSAKYGKNLLYSRNESKTNLYAMADSIAFCSEYNPAGVIGSILLDKYKEIPKYLSFKHHYMLSALEQEILIRILECMTAHKKILIKVNGRKAGTRQNFIICPLKIFVSVQNGKQYVLGYRYDIRRPQLNRLDKIYEVEELEEETDFEKLTGYGDRYSAHLWGTSEGYGIKGRDLEHIEMDIRVGKDEGYIVKRLEREKRRGSVSQINGETYRFSADVYDANELIPWIRTFIGRIDRLSCSNEKVVNLFNEDLAVMQAMYRGDDHDF